MLARSLLLSAQTALCGAVDEALRAASVEVRDNIIVLHAIYDGPISEDQNEVISIATTEIFCDLTSARYEDVIPEVRRVDAPERIFLKGWLIFARFENGTEFVDSRLLDPLPPAFVPYQHADVLDGVDLRLIGQSAVLFKVDRLLKTLSIEVKKSIIIHAYYPKPVSPLQRKLIDEIATAVSSNLPQPHKVSASIEYWRPGQRIKHKGSVIFDRFRGWEKEPLSK